MIPDFRDISLNNPELFPFDLVFDFEQWSKYENYIKVVGYSENYDKKLEMDQYRMQKGFKVVILATYSNDTNSDLLLSRIPQCHKML